MDRKLKLRVSNDWEEIVEITPGGKEEVIAGSHRLDVEDVLFALGYRFEIEEIIPEYNEDYDLGFDPFTGSFSDEL